MSIKEVGFGRKGGKELLGLIVSGEKMFLEMFHQQSKGLFFVITVKILKFGTPQTVAIIVLKIEKFDITLH